MTASVTSAALHGIDAYPIRVEVETARGGTEAFNTVGLPSSAVREGRVRVKSALARAGFRPSATKITINLAPADTCKDGAAFDLPIALGIIASEERLTERARAALRDAVVVGELSLGGEVRRVRGVLSIAIEARARGVRRLLVPAANAAEAAVVGGIDVHPIRSLPEAVAFLEGRADVPAVPPADALAAAATAADAVGDALPLDFAQVRGQETVKRALKAAVTDGHNVLLIGPPGCGKTLLARRLPGILPPMTREEAIETTRVWSVAGLLREGQALVTQRPFRAPHHTTSDAGLIGGGDVLRPGEVSLAHNGVLFLDEAPEFRRGAIELLREAVKEAAVTIGRARGSVRLPARFMLVAAMNHCPCGFRGSLRHACTCTAAQVSAYAQRTAPIRDMIDVIIRVGEVTP